MIGHVLNISVNNDYKKIFVLADEVGYDICLALPFFYAFSGCDTVSNIFKHTEVAMWDGMHGGRIHLMRI